MVAGLFNWCWQPVKACIGFRQHPLTPLISCGKALLLDRANAANEIALLEAPTTWQSVSSGSVHPALPVAGLCFCLHMWCFCFFSDSAMQRKLATEFRSECASAAAGTCSHCLELEQPRGECDFFHLDFETTTVSNTTIS